MKKLIISMLMIASCFGVANAQLMVDRLGKVATGYTLSNPNDTLYSGLSINARGSSSFDAYIKSSAKSGLRLQRIYDGNEAGSQYGIQVSNSSTSALYNYGVYSSATGENSSGSRRNVGVVGTSTSGETGSGIGVLGVIASSDVNGVGVYGGTNGPSRPVIQLNDIGRYAGYFFGDTRVTGTLTAGTVVTSSDYRLKENIRSLSSNDGCLGKLMNMNVVEFNNKQREYEISTIDMESEEGINMRKELTNGKAYWYDEDSPIIKNKHYGLIAQELKEIYPDLVVESQDGFLAINYLEIIPLLIRSVQELKAELDASKSGDAPIQKAQARNTDVTNMDAVVTTLYQNTPNPFTESTLIQCDVAETVVNADLYIYDMNGKQIETYPITERGATSITIEGRSLEAGMYLYALIADGQVIDTKRMILTK